MEVLQDTYREIKIGRIPKDWRVLKFREVFGFIKTSSHSKKEMVYSETDSEIYNVHYGAIHTTYKEQILDFEKYDVPRITDDSKLPREDQFLIDGDLVIVDASEDWGGMGECVELKNTVGKKVIGGLHTYAVRDKVNAFARGFTGYIFKNTIVRNKLASYANVSKVYGITKGNISNIPLVIPPLPEQQKIAAILSTVDEQISTTEQIIEKSKELKKGLMQKLFSEGIGHTEFKDTKIGRIPKDWDLEKLNDNVLKVGSGVTPKGGSSVYLKEGIPLIRSQNVLYGKLQLNGVACIDVPQYKKMKNSQLQENDVLLNISGASIGRSGVVSKNILPANVNQHVCIIRTTERINASYLSSYLISNGGQNQIFRLQAGGNREGLNFQHIRSFKIPLPSVSEQQKIATILSEADAKIEKEQTQKAKLDQLKKGLMQQLLTGKKRVKV